MYQQALLDHNKSIGLEPTGLSYYNRGHTYLILKGKIRAGADWKKDLDLGYKDAQRLIDDNYQQ
jgi:hypothetical protein